MHEKMSVVSTYADNIRYYSFFVGILPGRRGSKTPVANIYRFHGINGNLYVNYDKHTLSISDIANVF